jgi:DNA sulfur modification protein DndC
MSYRKRWLKILLWTERRLRRQGHDIELIRRDELQAIRQQWLWDPNEPDWADSLPAIYAAIYPDDPIEWLRDDSGTFSESDQQVLRELQQEHGVPAELIMKLMEVEHSMSGLARRKGLLNKLRGILGRDWESLDEVRDERSRLDQRSSYRKDIDEITKRYEALAS